MVSWSDNGIESDRDVEVDLLYDSWSDNGIESDSDLEVDLLYDS